MPLVADGHVFFRRHFQYPLDSDQGGWCVDRLDWPIRASKYEFQGIECNASRMRRTQGRQQDTAKILYFLPDLEDERSVVWLDFRIKRLLLDATSNEGPA